MTTGHRNRASELVEVLGGLADVFARDEAMLAGSVIEITDSPMPSRS